MKKRLIGLYLSCLMIGGCALFHKGPAPVTAKEYASFYNSSNYQLRDTLVEEGVSFVLTGITKEVDCARMVLSETDQIEMIKKYYDTASTVLSYELKIMLPSSGTDIYNYNPKSAITVSKRSEYFSFAFKGDIKMVSIKNDTVDCNYVLHERGMSNSPFAKFMMEFQPLDKGDQPMKIIINDKALTGKMIEFNIEQFSEARLPKLRFN